MRHRRRSGFTLLELMIVVAVLGILASIAIPKFADMVRKAGDGQTRANLGALRSALSIYYGDMEGQLPAQLASLTTSSKYLVTVPSSRLAPYHEALNAETGSAGPPAAEGGWWYDNAPGDANFGSVWANCVHTDAKGTLWTSY